MSIEVCDWPSLLSCFALKRTRQRYIVLVEVTLIPGTFRVVEPWKGDLKLGNLVTVPELQPPPGATEIVAYPKEFTDILKGGQNEQIPAQRVGSQMVLFLKKAVGEELDMHLQEQLRFWQATAPTLSVGWWNQDATPHAPLRERYMQTWELVRALERVHYRPASTTAEQLGNLWRSLPQLSDASGLNPMATECDKLVAEFRAN